VAWVPQVTDSSLYLHFSLAHYCSPFVLLYPFCISHVGFYALACPPMYQYLALGGTAILDDRRLAQRSLLRNQYGPVASCLIAYFVVWRYTLRSPQIRATVHTTSTERTLT
jgi:hypothetical protein